MQRESDGSPGYRREYQQAFLREVLLNGPIARKDIAPRIGVKAGSITRIARPAIDAGLVRERMEEPGELPVRPGRRFQPLSIDRRGGQVLGIAISPGVQAVALADIALNVVEGVELRIERVGDADRVIRRIAQESRRLIGRHVEDPGGAVMRVRRTVLGLLGAALMAAGAGEASAQSGPSNLSSHDAGFFAELLTGRVWVLERPNSARAADRGVIWGIHHAADGTALACIHLDGAWQARVDRWRVVSSPRFRTLYNYHGAGTEPDPGQVKGHVPVFYDPGTGRLHSETRNCATSITPMPPRCTRSRGARSTRSLRQWRPTTLT